MMFSDPEKLLPIQLQKGSICQHNVTTLGNKLTMNNTCTAFIILNGNGKKPRPKSHARNWKLVNTFCHCSNLVWFFLFTGPFISKIKVSKLKFKVFLIVLNAL